MDGGACPFGVVAQLLVSTNASIMDGADDKGITLAHIEAYVLRFADGTNGESAFKQALMALAKQALNELAMPDDAGEDLAEEVRTANP